MALGIKIDKKRDNVYSVELKGSLDTETAPGLEEKLKEIINSKPEAVILDMSWVDYISSAGIAAVLTAKKELKQQKAAFVMLNLQPQIEKVFEMLKVLPMFPIFKNMEEADEYIDHMIQEELKKQKGS